LSATVRSKDGPDGITHYWRARARRGPWRKSGHPKCQHHVAPGRRQVCRRHDDAWWANAYNCMLCLFSRQSSAFLEGAEPALLLMSEWLVPSCPGGLESVGGSRTSGVENRRLRRHAAVLRV